MGEALIFIPLEIMPCFPVAQIIIFWQFSERLKYSTEISNGIHCIFLLVMLRYIGYR